jgi:hypothetical protein
MLFSITLIFQALILKTRPKGKRPGGRAPARFARRLIMRSPELEKILEDHFLWWRTDGTEGTRLDLSGAILSGAGLTGADLRCADFTRANLSGADLTGAGLYEAIFVTAYAPCADFSGAFMRDADLTGADLTRVDLSWAELIGADLIRANLTGARLPQGIRQAPGNPADGRSSALQGD